MSEVIEESKAGGAEALSPDDPTLFDPELPAPCTADSKTIKPGDAVSPPSSSGDRKAEGVSPDDPTCYETGPDARTIKSQILAQNEVGGPVVPASADAPTCIPDAGEATRIEPPPPGSDPKHTPRPKSSGRLASSRLVSRRSSGRLRSSGHFGPGSEDGELFAGKYELLGEIARGGMGVVYRACQVDLNRIVALKVMLSGALASDEDKQRFIREANASARLQHPNIVRVYDIGEVEDNLYFTMDFVKGKELSERKKDLDRDALLDVMIKVCDGVSYAHHRMIIHRDLKPANIMMDADDEPLIMDFGLAKQVGVIDAEGQPSLRTREGSVMGTPHYMAPEQAEGLVSEIDVRSDVYTLGVILYELWTGKLPFEAPTIAGLIMRILEEDPTPPRQLDKSIDWDIEAIILKAMEKKKEKRYQTAAELKLDLERTRDGLTILARRATVFYRGKKWARRNRRGLSVTALVVAMGCLSGAFAVYKSGENKRQANERFAVQLRETRTTQTDLDHEHTSLLEEIEAFWAKRGEYGQARSKRSQVLDGRTRALGARFAAAGEALRPYVAEREAASDGEGAKDTARALALLSAHENVLTEVGAAFATLKRTHGSLAKAGEKLDELRGLEEEIVRELDGAEWSLPASATLAEAQASFENLLARSRDPNAKAEEGDVTSAPAFTSLAHEIELEAFAAIGLIGEAAQRFQGAFSDDAARTDDEDLPELRHARRIHQTVGKLQSDVEGKLGQARRIRLAALMRACGERLLELLAREAQAAGENALGELLGVARLAQALIQRGLEAKEDEQLTAARFQANRVCAELLLAMKAYSVLDAELRSEDAFRPKDLAELRHKRMLALADTEQLKRDLRELVDYKSLDLASLEAHVRHLESLQGNPALDVELERSRSSGLERARGARRLKRRVLAKAYVDKALARVQKLRDGVKGKGPTELANAFAELLAGWDTVEAAWDEKQEQLREQHAEGVRTCKIERAELHYRVAVDLAEIDPKFALESAREATRLFGELIADFKAVPKVPETKLDAAKLQGEKLTRETERPEGMVLIKGYRGVELGGGPQTRNPPRTVTIEPFYLAIHEVTNQDYREFVRSPKYGDPAFWRRAGIDKKHVGSWPSGWTQRRPPEGREKFPVVGINWYEARGYAAFRRRRLPSDDEWEYAARYQRRKLQDYPWAGAWRAGLLLATLEPPGVNRFDRTPGGLLDMGGNASEWVVLTEGGNEKPAARGGSFLYPTKRYASGKFRFLPPAPYRGPQLGIRLAKGLR